VVAYSVLTVVLAFYIIADCERVQGFALSLDPPPVSPAHRAHPVGHGNDRRRLEERRDDGEAEPPRLPNPTR
jgi:hypothetical protein